MRYKIASFGKTSAGLILLLGSTLWLAGCGGDTPPTATSVLGSPTAAKTAQAAPTPTIAFGPEATATPVILPTNPAVATSRPTPPIPNDASRTNSGPAATVPAATTSAAFAATIAPTPTPPSFAPLTGYPGKLSILGSDLYIYVSRFDNKPPQLILGKAGVTVGLNQDGEIFRFPTWSKDGTKLAAMGLNIKSGQTQSVNVYVAAADGSGTYKVQDSEAVSPVYISWSPDGNFLSLLMGVVNGDTLELRLADTSKGAAGAKTAGLRKVAVGNPLYTSWSNDSDSLAIHTLTGGIDTLSMVKAKSSGASSPQPLNFKGEPGAFRAPHWSANGAYLAFSTSQGNLNDEAITIQDKTGTNLGVIDTAGQGASFNWSPDGSKLAFGFRDTSREGVYLGLNISDLAGPDAPKNGKISFSKAATDPVIAFFWSPDGKKLAYLTFNESQSRVLWNIYDVTTKKSTKLVEWYPNSTLVQVLSYFDQYAQSDSIWSPDSKALVFSGWINSTITADGKAFGPAVVYVLPTEGAKAGQPQPVAPGQVSFWSK